MYAEVVCTGLEAITAAIRAVVELPLPVREKMERLTRIAIMEVRSDADLNAMLRDVAEHLTPAQRARVAAAHRNLEAAYEALMRIGIARGELREHDPRLLAHAYAHLLAAFAGRVGVEAGFQGRQASVDAVVNLFLRGAGPATIPETR